MLVIATNFITRQLVSYGLVKTLSGSGLFPSDLALQRRLCIQLVSFFQIPTVLLFHLEYWLVESIDEGSNRGWPPLSH